MIAVAAILVAAGRGRRMGGDKLWIERWPVEFDAGECVL
jgi:CTP:molybdopterin cytidylyltransferase MocA